MSSSRLYVGGLDYQMNDSELRRAFARFGHIAEARIVYDRYSDRSRGFGFVTFESPDAAHDAIREMDGAYVQGRALKVELSGERRGSFSGPPPGVRFEPHRYEPPHAPAEKYDRRHPFRSYSQSKAAEEEMPREPIRKAVQHTPAHGHAFKGRDVTPSPPSHVRLRAECPCYFCRIPVELQGEICRYLCASNMTTLLPTSRCWYHRLRLFGRF
eukprot:gnl/Trimastix_PCT/3720.p1 GENE.gnl/Trimastix_PCT/3720~~gnl/Trimastix_PCT/3720.p1  ORF type:complete len:213 (+),score=33.10 gnl/Trimastix_PCT/3720:72-710(+)